MTINKHPDMMDPPIGKSVVGTSTKPLNELEKNIIRFQRYLKDIPIQVVSNKKDITKVNEINVASPKDGGDGAIILKLKTIK